MAALTPTEWAIASRAWKAMAKGHHGANLVHRACTGRAGEGVNAEELDALIWRWRAAVTHSAPLD